MMLAGLGADLAVDGAAARKDLLVDGGRPGSAMGLLCWESAAAWRGIGDLAVVDYARPMRGDATNGRSMLGLMVWLRVEACSAMDWINGRLLVGGRAATAGGEGIVRLMRLGLG